MNLCEIGYCLHSVSTLTLMKTGVFKRSVCTIKKLQKNQGAPVLIFSLIVECPSAETHTIQLLTVGRCTENSVFNAFN